MADFFTSKSTLDSILFAVSVAATFEWLASGILVLSTFFNVMVNHDKTTSISACFIVMFAYIAIRSMFLPFIFLGIFGENGKFIYESMKNVFFWLPTVSRLSTIILALWWNVILILPCITVWYTRARFGIGNKRLPEVLNGFEYKYIVILPVYNETYGLLVSGIKSILRSNCFRDQLEIHVSFDSDFQSDVYTSLLKSFRLKNKNDQTTMSISIKGVDLYIHKFPHAGKRITQARTYDFVKKMRCGRAELKDTSCGDFDDKTIFLFTDSDNFLYDNAIHNLTYNFDRNPDKLAFAGYMTCMSSGRNALNIWRLIQDTEYIGGEINRSFELLMGTVNCLPGGFTAIRASALQSIADQYFSTLPSECITDYHRNYLGEDRFLTHVMHQNFPKYSLGFCPSARCKTDPPNNFSQLVKQRRRWLLGAISNEAYMLCDSAIWKKYKFMLVFKIFQMAWKSTTLGQIVLSIIAIQNWKSDSHGIDWSNVTPFLFSVGVPLTISWIVVILTGIKLGHYKVIFIYPIMHVFQLFVTFAVDIYSIFTWKKRTWGGARISPV